MSFFEYFCLTLPLVKVYSKPLRNKYRLDLRPFAVLSSFSPIPSNLCIHYTCRVVTGKCLKIGNLYIVSNLYYLLVMKANPLMVDTEVMGLSPTLYSLLILITRSLIQISSPKL